jgi:heme/copper-type cytochrome/quinol oxidase subunit 2
MQTKLLNDRPDNLNKKHSVGFFFLMIIGIIIGLFTGSIVIAIIFAGSWAKDVFSLPTPLNATTILLSGVIIIIILIIVWRTHKMFIAK